MSPMPFPIPPLFIRAVKDICAINTFQKLLKILFSDIRCRYFGFTALLFSATTTDMSLAIWSIKVVSPLTTRILVFSSSPARRPWCITPNCMSRLENHAMLRDAATDVFNVQYALVEKYGLAAIEGIFFRGKVIFRLLFTWRTNPFIGLFICFCTTPA